MENFPIKTIALGPAHFHFLIPLKSAQDFTKVQTFLHEKPLTKVGINVVKFSFIFRYVANSQ